VAFRDLRGFVENSFEILAREAPGSYERLSRTLAGHSMCVIDGRRRFRVEFDPGRVSCGPPAGDESIAAAVDRRTILELVDGLLTLDDALREDRFVVKASPRLAAVVFDALSIYLRGAVRCPSFVNLLSELRSSS